MIYYLLQKLKNKVVLEIVLILIYLHFQDLAAVSRLLVTTVLHITIVKLSGQSRPYSKQLMLGQVRLC